MSRELFDNLITEFGATVGIGDLAPDEGGFLALAINDFVLNIQHEPEKDEILLFAKLGTVDDPNPVPIYEKLLAGNLYWQGTAGGTLSIDLNEMAIHLVRAVNMQPLGVEDVQRLVDGFIRTAEYWIGEIENYDSDTLSILSNAEAESLGTTQDAIIRV